MCPTECVEEGSLQVPALRTSRSYASVQHEEVEVVIDILHFIQAGQKDLENCLTLIEHLLVETKEGFKPTEALAQLDLFQNMRLNKYALRHSSTVNQDRRAGAALSSRSMPIISPEDQMIEEAQEPRKRMHEAVDQIEVSSDDIAW